MEEEGRLCLGAGGGGDSSRSNRSRRRSSLTMTKNPPAPKSPRCFTTCGAQRCVLVEVVQAHPPGAAVAEVAGDGLRVAVEGHGASVTWWRSAQDMLQHRSAQQGDQVWAVLSSRAGAACPAPPAKMTAFIAKGHPFPKIIRCGRPQNKEPSTRVSSSMDGLIWLYSDALPPLQPQSTGMVSSSRIQSSTCTTL